MNSVYLVCFIVVLAVFPNKGLSQNPDLITKTCDKTLHKDLCNSILRSHPKSAQADLHGLAIIVLQDAKADAWKIKEHIDVLTKATSDDTLIKMCLKEFAGNIADAVNEIEESIKALDGKKYADVITWISAAMTNLDTCGDGFDADAKPVYDPALTELTEKYTKVCSIELGITNLLSGVVN
ncbi:hypothetical protein ACFE04_003960 [Oxalis oulophora]